MKNIWKLKFHLFWCKSWQSEMIQWQSQSWIQNILNIFQDPPDPDQICTQHNILQQQLMFLCHSSSPDIFWICTSYRERCSWRHTASSPPPCWCRGACCSCTETCWSGHSILLASDTSSLTSQVEKLEKLLQRFFTFFARQKWPCT